MWRKAVDREGGDDGFGRLHPLLGVDDFGQHLRPPGLVVLHPAGPLTTRFPPASCRMPAAKRIRIASSSSKDSTCIMTTTTRKSWLLQPTTCNRRATALTHSGPPADGPRIWPSDGPPSTAALSAAALPWPGAASSGRTSGEWGSDGAGSTERRIARRRRSSVLFLRASTCAAMLRMETSNRASSSTAHAGISSCGSRSKF